MIVYLSVSSKNYSLLAYSSMCYLFKSISWVSSLVFSIGFIWSCGYSKRTEFILGWLRVILSLGGADLDVPVFLLKYLGIDTLLWLFWRSFSISSCFLMNNGPLKGHYSNFPSCCINNYLNTLLLIPHEGHYYFRYGIDDVIGIW